MHKHYGPLHWWPGESPFEVMVGAILTQNTAWTNVEKAIINLKKKNLLEPRKLYHLKPTVLANLIRPAGFFRVKTQRLRNFLKFLLEECEGDISKLKRQPLDQLRQKLLAVNGVGPETADSILLYALGKPIFVIDAYTKRIFSRHDLAKKDIDYHALQKLLMTHFKPDVVFYNEYHAQLVNIGKDFCRTKPRCEKCPLNGFRRALV
ncbi:MAG: endonuclease III domain-containing protein [Deltaproteobacteria bacterium]|nr:endonuclease III domain-containing protein [Deltaproteobacteria bacterium]